MRYGYAFARSRPLGISRDNLVVLKMGISLWAIVFALFTFRSFTLPLSYVGEQAGLRCIMMSVGAGLCGLLYAATNRVRSLSLALQAAILGLAVVASGAFYSSANYVLLYVVA